MKLSALTRIGILPPPLFRMFSVAVRCMPEEAAHQAARYPSAL